MSDKDTADQIIQTTVRIETLYADGEGGSGTGFFVRFCNDADGYVPVIVTNRHVIEGARGGAFHLRFADQEGALKQGEKLRVDLGEFEQRWVPHPDPAIDLAALPIAEQLRDVQAVGQRLHLRMWQTDNFADEAYLNKLTAIENILMIGYPNALWDGHNNLPIVRSGITATPAFIDFEGRREFLIDCACFPGSSGSPVLFYDRNGYKAENGDMLFGMTRVKFLGVLYAGPYCTINGELKLEPAPTTLRPVIRSSLPINLGYCIKASQLMAFETELRRDLKQKKGHAAQYTVVQ